MPPSRSVSAFGLRGYVCRSCLLKSSKPEVPLRRWLSRTIVVDKPTKPEQKKVPRLSHPQPAREERGITPASNVKFFEEDSDGARREIPHVIEDDTFTRSLESTIQDARHELDLPEDFSFDGIFSKEEIKDILGENRHLSEEQFEDLLDKQDEEEEKREEDEYDELDVKDGDLEGMPPDFIKNSDRLQVLVDKLKYESKELDEDDKLDLQEEIQELHEKVMEHLSEDERQKLTDVIYNTGPEDIAAGYTPSPDIQLEKPAQTDEDVTNPNVSEQISEEYFSGTLRSRIRRLNSALREAYNHQRRINQTSATALPHKIQAKIWKEYAMCRLDLVNEAKAIHPDVWHLLWYSFESRNALNTGRMDHINILGKDMVKAGVELGKQQHLLFLESIFISENHAKGLERWQAAKDVLGDDNLCLRSYWKLGIRMYSQAGDRLKALEAVDSLISRTREPNDFRIVIPLIRAYLGTGDKAADQKAFALYELLRSHLGSNMSMQDYDAVTSLFLEADKPDKALMVFRDMMLSDEHSRQCGNDSSVHVDLISIDRMPFDMNQSKSLANLPSKFNNKFFFGKWMKKLIGDGQLDAARRVIGLMEDRGVLPDARHLNGLIGAYFRNGNPSQQKVAEQLAWKMITARIEFVEARQQQRQFSFPLRPVASTAKPDHKSPLFVPKATIETFSILLDEYKHRQNPKLIPDLFANLKRAQIPPDVFFMNQYLMADTITSQAAYVWDGYRYFVEQLNVHPNFDTFTYLWYVMKNIAQPLKRNRNGTTEFPWCRELFSEMVKQKAFLEKKDRIPRELYDHVILSFGLKKDHTGTAIALRALHKYFGMLPYEDTMRSVVLQLTSSSLTNQRGRRSVRLKTRDPAIKDRISQVSRVLAEFKKEREDVLGVTLDQMPEEQRLEETLSILVKLLAHATVGRTDTNEVTVEGLLREAAIEMGVPDCADGGNVL